jgi:hypothetical protein
VTTAPIFSRLRRIVCALARASSLRLDEHVGEGGEPQAQLVDAEGVRREPVGEQLELRLLDAVLHLAASAVQLLVGRPGRPVARGEAGDHEARVRLVAALPPD